MEHLHSINILHRDFKPQNILVSRDLCTSKLCDLGQAKEQNPEQSTCESGSECVKGTKGFRDPLYERGKEKFRSRTEVYSFGVVVAVVLTGNLEPEEAKRVVW